MANMPAPLPVVLPALPKSWSELSWRQLCAVWQCKLRYGGNADVARAAALLALLGLEAAVETEGRNNGITALRYDERTGEAVYTLRDGDGRLWAVTPRELSQLARQTMKWFDYPYGDPGKEAVRDEKGKVVEEAVEPVRGYVNTEWRDAMQLPEETLVVCGTAPYSPEAVTDTFRLMEKAYRASLDIRRQGSAALDLCSVAAGRAGAYFELALSLWDYAAGAILVEEAGGICTRLDGTPLPYDASRPTILAGGRAAYEELRRLAAET